MKHDTIRAVTMLLLAALLLALFVLPPEWVYRMWQKAMVGPFSCTAWARRVDRWLGERV